MNWSVYIIKSQSRKWYYVGSTNRLEERLLEHNKGKVRSTRPYKPLSLVFTKNFSTEKDARDYEKLLKDNRIEKEKIIKKIEGN